MQRKHLYLMPVLSFLLVVRSFASPVDLGHLSGVVKDQNGKPLGNLVVALVARTAGEVLPILTRTDGAGRLQFSDVESGLYELQVKSSAYHSPDGRVVEIAAGRTASVSLVLHQLLSLGPDDRQNVGIKTLLRSAVDKRVIFRSRDGIPAPETRAPSPFDSATFEIYSNAGLGRADASGETTTNFAFRETLGTANYVVAGQVGTGADTSWRIKNRLTYDLADNHSLQLLMGYGRFNSGPPNISALEAPFDSSQLYQSAGALNVLTLGLSDQLSFGDLIALNWGFELNKVRGGLPEETLVSPNAELTIRPIDSLSFQARLASKRETLGDTIDLPDGERVNLADAVSLAMLDAQSNELARTRFWEASLTQKVSKATELQITAFRNQFFGSSTPFFALVGGPSPEFFKMPAEVSENQGYKFTVRQKFGENFKASLSYVNASADGLGAKEPSLLVERGALETLIRRQGYHALAAQLDAVIPATHTRLTALLKAVAGGGRPITTLDAISDFYETGNQGVNLYVRQLVPVPISWLEFLGLDFLQSYKFEALLDVRNLTNEEFGLLRTAQGNLVLVQNPRTFRGGIAVNF